MYIARILFVIQNKSLKILLDFRNRKKKNYKIKSKKHKETERSQ